MDLYCCIAISPSQFALTIQLQGMHALFDRHWNDPLGYYQITAMHAGPFIPYDGVINPELGHWIGGYCNHVNVLFGTWHRAHTALLEQRLVQEALSIASKYPKKYRDAYMAAAERVRFPIWDYARTITGQEVGASL